MAKKKNWGGEDTRGAKAKAQKAASRAEKDAANARRKAKAEAAAWTDNVTERKANRKQAKEEKEMQRRAKLEAKKALMAAEEKEMAGIKAKGKRRKAQLAAGSSTWEKKQLSGKAQGVSMKNMAARQIKVPEDFIKGILVKFYTEHNKEKLDNIDKIMEKFRGKWAKLEAGLRKQYPDHAPNFEALWAKEKERREKAEALKLKDFIDSREAAENQNHILAEQREAGVAVAFGVDETLAQMSSIVKGDAKADRNPEKRRKAAFKAFEEREMSRLREENPKLKRSQLKERIFALWKKSPENPMNQIQQ